MPPEEQLRELWLETLKRTAHTPLEGGVFMSSTNVIIRAQEVLPLYNLLTDADPLMENLELRRLRVTVASVLQSQVEDGMIRGAYVLNDNRQERRHGN